MTATSLDVDEYDLSPEGGRRRFKPAMSTWSKYPEICDPRGPTPASEQAITRRLRHGHRPHAYVLLAVDDILYRVDLVLNDRSACHQLDPIGLSEALGTELLENA
ncbi:hypothetical protein AB0J48_35645 [Nocardia salmonicida]|uniref:hypothetical protein n=1 Tax=Nocardia salmonicida TaxID=53431 RepID=UPI00342F96BB